MKNRIAIFRACNRCPGSARARADLAAALAARFEKELAARASDVTEVTLGKNMLAFAAKFMNGKDKDDAAARQLIEGLDGIYVRDYEFDKEGQYSMDELKQLRAAFRGRSGRPSCTSASGRAAKPPT